MPGHWLFSVFVGVLISCAAFCEAAPPSLPEIDYPLVDDISYDEPAARSFWQPMAGSEAVGVTKLENRQALKLPCNFKGTTIDRASWDRQIQLDLTMSDGLQFWFYSPDTTPVSTFTLYFHSGNGWYSVGFSPEAKEDKWVPVEIKKKNAQREGNPAGWGSVDTIRLSAWRGVDRDTVFYIAAPGLLESNAKIALLRGDSAAGKIGDEIKAVRQYTEIMARFLDELGLSQVVLSDLEVTAERLKKIKLVILPYNPYMTDDVVNQMARFLQEGGKIICCYHLPGPLQAAMGINSGPPLPQKYEGHFASIRPSDHPIAGLGAQTGQASWNIMEAQPVEGRSRVAAWWYDNQGNSTQKPALIVSDNSVYLTHVLLNDDRENKRQMLLAMVNNLAGELLQEAAQLIYKRMGAVEPYEDFDSARKAIWERAGDSPPAQTAWNEALQQRKQSQTYSTEGNFLQAVTAGQKAREQLVQANYLAQKPLAGEHRAFWCHSAFGVAGMDWDQAVKLLADNGFTAILPNMLWGGVAFYESEMLPVAPAVREQGDQIALCVAACKKYGVACHVWKVNFYMGAATSGEFVEQMKAQGRSQVRYDGSLQQRWLCPSHPENQKLEIESMLEVARKYQVDGVHFDYIRYPDSDGCFCPGCRERFEKALGRVIENWPGDLRKEAEWNDKWPAFRREQITAVVAAVARQARQIRPGIKISAAVFTNWPSDRNTIGQDWKLWCERGYLDFVCPMDYTDNSHNFQTMLERQLDWTGKVPCYPGIGLTVWTDPTDISKLVHQINTTRALKTGGFTIFNYGPVEANQVLPLLGKGLTRKNK